MVNNEVVVKKYPRGSLILQCRLKGIRRKVADSAGDKRIEIQKTVKRRAREFEPAALFLTLMDACVISNSHHSGIKGACGNGNGSSL